MPALAPSPTDLRLLFDVVRTDLEREWAAGRRPRARDYASSLPELFSDPAAVRQLDELERLLAGSSRDLTTTPAPRGELDLTHGSTVTPTPPPSRRADDPAPPLVFPQVGDKVAGFRLTGELGRGAFGRVYLAEQTALAGRPVALKLTSRTSREAQRLAKLRHTNVVPVYSVHDLPGLQAVCMPVLGRLTLADLVTDFRRTGSFAGSVVSTVARGPDSTHQPGHAPAAPADPLPAAVPPGVAARFAGRTHVERVVWIGSRLAAGLAHAHAVGILHLDLKPANVLLADDGEPVLLDFNLSYDVPTRDRERAGGTLPYMAPEQLDDYRLGGPPRVDARTDLFGLGVVLYELLTGRQPFPMTPGRLDMAALVAARRQPPAGVRTLNPAVPPAVEGLVRKLLAPAPNDRYQSAADLLADLDRQQADLPLKHAPNPSAAERLAKWRRRNPRAWVPAALVLVTALAGGLGYRTVNQAAVAAERAAKDQAGGVRAELPRLRADLTHLDDAFAAADRAAGLKRGAELLAGYGLPGDADWLSRPAVRDLPAADRAATQDALGELALLLAHAETLGGADPAAYERARGWNRAAEAAFAGRPLPATVAAQRRRLGPDLPPPAAAAADVPGIDLYLTAAAALAEHRTRPAVEALEKLCDREPGHFAAQFALADCRQRTADGLRAVERFEVAAALAPADPRPHYHRGRLLLGQVRHHEAAAALTAAITRRPDCPDFLSLRAVARKRGDDLKGAEADLLAAQTAGGPPATVLPLLAEVREAAGDAAGAAAAAAEARRHEPQSAYQYLLRGRAKLPADPAGALADFEQSAKLNPLMATAWQSVAHVLADRLGRPRDALAAADRAVQAGPDQPLVLAARGVIHARLGDRAAAHADADRAVRLNGDPRVRLRVACVYALTSGGHPADADRAADLLTAAVRDGLKPAVIAADPDLGAVRGRADVKGLMAE